jgi:hypothetical protein
MRNRLFKTLIIAASLSTAACLPIQSGADAAGDRKRAQLLNVKRLLVVPVFFGTDTLGELPAAKAGAMTDKKREPKPKPELDAKQKAALAEYLDALRKLESNAREKLRARVAARTTFEVIKVEEVDRALTDLKITPPEMFQSAGRLNNKKFELPDAEQVKRLASQVHADAVLLGVLDEPRKSTGGYYFDPLAGPGYDSPKVHDKATFDLMLADGTLVLRQTLDVVHPLTRIGTRQFVLADWIETDDQIIEDLMDEVTRYTPKQ